MFFRSFSLQMLFLLAVTIASRDGSLTPSVLSGLLGALDAFSFVVEGIAIVCTADGSQLYNAERFEEWLSFTKASLRAACYLGILFMMLFLFSGKHFISIFTSEENVVSVSMTVFAYIACMQSLNAVVFALDGIMFGLERFFSLGQRLYNRA